MVRTEELTYTYERRDESGALTETQEALTGISLEITPGDFVAILGTNGSGKSTFAKQLNALLTPTGGTVWICGMNTAKDENLWPVREAAGMVFQNPDNQIIATVVEEDVGFGPENIGVPTEEILKRVAESLEAVGMTAYAQAAPNRLSGGQKQRIAIAGVLAMKPKLIILDEPTAMLDPGGRREVIRTVRELSRREHITILLITHYMEETVDADRIIVLDRGRVLRDGTPKDIFSRVEEMEALGLDVPPVTKLAFLLKQRGIPVSSGILSENELLNELMKLKEENFHL